MKIVKYKCSITNSSFNKFNLLRYTNTKRFVKSKLSEKTSLNAVASDLERDDDPLSIRRLSSTSLGIIIAFLTISLPSISVLLGRSLYPSNEVNQNHSIKKDGS